MALVLCARCGLPVYLPPGYAGSLCSCGRGNHPPAAVGAPSPASAAAPSTTTDGTNSLRTGRFDGGGRASDSASGSPGRGAEKGPQRSPQGKGAPIEAAAKPEGITEDWKPDRDLLEKADAFFETKFYKKGGIGDNDWKPLLAACKTWGLPKDVKWRDWLKDEWNDNRANAVRVLITAKAIEGAQPVPPELKPLLDWIKAHPKATLADMQAQVGPKVSQDDIDKLTDLGLLYEPVLGKWEAT